MDLRKLDAAIAKHVMMLGEPVISQAHGYVITDGKSMTSIPTYSKSIGAAWEVVERLDLFSDNYLAHDIDYDSIETRQNAWQKKWQVRHYVNSEEYDDIAIADTASLAICLAALKTKGIDVSEWEK